MKLWERTQNEINSWQAVIITQSGLALTWVGVFIVITEIFKPGTQFGLAIAGMGIALTGAGDALATYETKIEKHTSIGKGE